MLIMEPVSQIFKSTEEGREEREEGEEETGSKKGKE